MALTEFLTTDKALASVLNTKVVTPSNLHINSTENPHAVTKTQVGLSDVINDEQIPRSIIDAAGDLIYGSAADTPAILAKGADGDFLTLSGGLPAWVETNNAQIFTESGTWVKPAGAKYVCIDVVGGGGGGGGGFHYTTSPSGVYSSGGGGGGARQIRIIAAENLPDNVPVTVGSGGSGGAGRAITTGFGTAGGNGGLSKFGDLVTAYGGTGGHGGSTTKNGCTGGGWLSAGTLTVGGQPRPSIFTGNDCIGGGGGSIGTTMSGGCTEYGGASGATGSTSDGIGGGSSVYGGAGGGGGGFWMDTYAGGRGGSNGSYTFGTGALAGQPGESSTINAGGGGGGGNGTGGSKNGNNGGNGGIPGGGGGGGSSTYLDAYTAGSGGNGGRGEVRVYAW